MHFHTSSKPVPLQLAALGPDSPVTFLIKPLTQDDVDRLGFELFRHNIVPVSNETIRATLIDEIFVLFGDKEGEVKADLLDAFWQAQDLYNEQEAEWSLQEDQRLLDQANGAPKRPHAPLPEHTLPLRQRASAQLFIEEMRNKSLRLRELTIEMQTYELRQQEGMVRLILENWEGLKVPFAKVDGIVPEATWRALKDEVPKEAIRELVRKSFDMGKVTEEERGNSDSPLDSGSDPTGSPEPSGGSASSDGSSTASSTGLAPPAASDVIIESSSNSTSDVTGSTLSSASSPTAEATLSSQSV